jgi:CheY-like chemotaxis protein
MSNHENPVLLIVDDEIAYRKFIRKVVESYFNAEVYEAPNPKEAFDILREHPVDLILLDMQMPVMDGLTMLKHLRAVKETSDTPVIACTALANLDLLAQLVKLNIADYIIKPINIHMLTEKLRKVFKDYSIKNKENIQEQKGRALEH